MFNLRLESFDAASKAKVIREVKATIANMNLMEVSVSHYLVIILSLTPTRYRQRSLQSLSRKC